MIRIQACHDIWTIQPEIQPGMNNPEAPLLAFKVDHSLGLGPCFPSSELLFTGISVGLIRSNVYYHDGEPFSIRVFGIVKGLWLAVSATLISVYLLKNKNPFSALLNSVVFAFILTDPANSLYLSTFYTEFSALVFLYLSIVLICLVGTRRGQVLLSLLLGISLLLLGLSKPQHILLPVGLLASLVLVTLRDLNSIRTPLIMGILAIVFLGFFQTQNLRHERYRNQMLANATNVYLGAVLPSASDPYVAATFLGLPPRCANHAGENWYTPGLQDAHPCPEVGQVSRLRMLSLMAKDPAVFVNMTSSGVRSLRPWLVDLGQVEGQIDGRVMDYAFSFSEWLDQPGEKLFFVAFLLPLLSFFGGIATLIFRPSSRACQILLLDLMLTGTLYIIFYSALLGDGFVDFSKHAHLFFSVYLTWTLIAITGVGAWVWEVVRKRKPSNGDPFLKLGA